MKFTSSQTKLVTLLKEQSYSLLCVLNGKEKKYYLLDTDFNKVDTIRKDNAEKVLAALNTPLRLRTKTRSLYTFRSATLKNFDLDSINLYPAKLSNRTIHSLIWNKRGEYGVGNIKLVYSVDSVDVVKDIHQDFLEYVTIEKLLLVSSKSDVVVLSQLNHYSLDIPEIKDAEQVVVGGIRVECSKEMKDNLKLVTEKLNYFKGLRFEYVDTCTAV